MNAIEKINSTGWADWSFGGLDTNYDRVCAKISYNAGGYYDWDSTADEQYSEVQLIICCSNYIGFSFIGHWDENIIESIRVEMSGDLIESSLHEVKRVYGDVPKILGGGIKKIDDVWYQLNIKLIDGNVIKIVCSSISIESKAMFVETWKAKDDPIL